MLYFPDGEMGLPRRTDGEDAATPREETEVTEATPRFIGQSELLPGAWPASRS